MSYTKILPIMGRRISTKSSTLIGKILWKQTADSWQVAKGAVGPWRETFKRETLHREAEASYAQLATALSFK